MNKITTLLLTLVLTTACFASGIYGPNAENIREHKQTLKEYKDWLSNEKGQLLIDQETIKSDKQASIQELYKDYAQIKFLKNFLSDPDVEVKSIYDEIIEVNIAISETKETIARYNLQLKRLWNDYHRVQKEYLRIKRNGA